MKKKILSLLVFYLQLKDSIYRP